MRKRRPHQFPWRATARWFSLGRRSDRGCKAPFGGHRHEKAKARRAQQLAHADAQAATREHRRKRLRSEAARWGATL